MMNVKKAGLLNLIVLLIILFIRNVVAGTVEDFTLIRNCETGDTPAVIKALEDGANINARDKNGGTALMAAVNFGQTKIVKLLIEKGADVNAKQIDGGLTALMIASLGERPNNVEIVEILLAKGADVNAKNNMGMTALMYASYYNLIDVANVLIDNGADVNAKRDGNLLTPLGYAMDNAHFTESPEMIKLLRKSGAKK
jgi:uncharacterized protein